MIAFDEPPETTEPQLPPPPSGVPFFEGCLFSTVISVVLWGLIGLAFYIAHS